MPFGVKRKLNVSCDRPGASASMMAMPDDNDANPRSRDAREAAMIDCMLVGFNAGSPQDNVALLRLGAQRSVGYRDANLTFVEASGHVHTSMELVDAHCALRTSGAPPLSNADFLWPAITTIGTHLHGKGLSFDYVRLFQADKGKLADRLARGEVRLVAITTTVYVSPAPIIEIVQFVRSIDPRVPVVIGGPAVAGWPKLYEAGELQRQMTEYAVDFYVFSSEGEACLARLIEALKCCAPDGLPGGHPSALGEQLARIPNLAYRSDAGYVVNAAEPEDNALESNMTRYELFPREDFGEFVTVRTAKSCPFACAFCGFPERAGAYRYLDVENVRQELNAIRAIGGVTTVTFIDDTFNVPKGRFKSLLRMMIDERFGFRWNSYLRSDHVDDEVLQLMAESGCEGVFLGVESGSARILEAMNKKSRPHHYAHVIERCRQLGIVTYASLIIGFPGETVESVKETMAFLETSRPDFFRAQPWFADPVTPVYRNGREHALQGSGFEWRHATMDSDQAMAFVEHLFLTVRGSTWLPQNDFELWSVFYLQRKGMTLAGIKGLLAHFNGAIRKKLLFEDQETLTAEEYRHLAGGFAAPDTRAPLYTPEQVGAGIDAWQRRGVDAPAAGGGLARQSGGRGEIRRIEVAQSADPDVLRTVAATLWRVLADETGLRRAAIPLVELRDGEPGVDCACLDAAATPTDRDVMAELGHDARRRATQGAAFLYLTNNPVLAKALNLSLPAIAFACLDGGAEPDSGLRMLRSGWPRQFQSVKLMLVGTGSAPGTRVYLDYEAGVFADDDVGELVALLVRRLDRLATNAPAGSGGENFAVPEAAVGVESDDSFFDF